MLDYIPYRLCPPFRLIESLNAAQFRDLSLGFLNLRGNARQPVVDALAMDPGTALMPSATLDDTAMPGLWAVPTPHMRVWTSSLQLLRVLSLLFSYLHSHEKTQYESRLRMVMAQV